MPRTPATPDVFNAIADPRRRQIIDLLSHGADWLWGRLSLTLGLPQPAVSKHLGVLREAGIVSVRKRQKPGLRAESRPIADRAGLGPNA